MSIRRKSCDPCFRARRKCDLGFPVCERCENSSKSCRYRYPPTDLRPGGNTETAVAVQKSFNSIPQGLGNLGRLSPITGTANYEWAFDRLRDCPLAFARQAETMFINKHLYGSSFPRPLRAAFGVCASCATINEYNETVVFQALDAEMSELLVQEDTGNLLDGLVKLQAALLYQIVRVFYGGVHQRMAAEQQEYIVRAFALSLLRRVATETETMHRTWESWILAESVRRTVFVLFKLYTLYSSFRYGVCSEYKAITILPVSTKAQSWSSREAFLRHAGTDDTVTYREFSSSWASAPHQVDLFEKLLLIGCLGAKGYQNASKTVGARLIEPV